MSSDNSRRGSLPDVPWQITGVGHGTMNRTCYGKAGNCGPRSPVGSTRPGGKFYCAACSAIRADRKARAAA